MWCVTMVFYYQATSLVDGRIKTKEGNLEVKGDEVYMPTSTQEKTQQHALNVIPKSYDGSIFKKEYLIRLSVYESKYKMCKKHMQIIIH